MILKELVDLIEKAKIIIGMDYDKIRMCELGDQKMKWNRFGTGKNYFKDKNILEHISLDLNGKHGAIRVDLRKPITKWKNYFDMVTDYGTIEHVGDQYGVFKNVHNITKPGGAIIHTLPQIGHWELHCNFHYDFNFFNELSNRCHYDVKLMESRNIPGRINRSGNLVCCILIKRDSSEFLNETEFNQIKGLCKK